MGAFASKGEAAELPELGSLVSQDRSTSTAVQINYSMRSKNVCHHTLWK